MGNKIFNRFIATVLAFVMTIGCFGDMSVFAYESADIPEGQYEIYPQPQKIEYAGSNWELGKNANVVIEEGIDDYTLDRLEETLSLKNIGMTKSDKIAANGFNILVGIHGSNGLVDQYVKNNCDIETTNLFTKTDSYYLATLENTIVVLGKDTDAAFYAITTLYHVLAQMVDTTNISVFEIEDWADVVSRGFIEGYYGNPWSLEDRIKLMEWGGYYKLNSYFYAPKDDPKHCFHS